MVNRFRSKKIFQRTFVLIKKLFKMGNYKKLTGKAVMDVATSLIIKNGETTTLDVKKELRSQGYYAEQLEVSDIMDNNYKNYLMDFSNRSNHRVYTLIGVQTATTKTTFSSAGGLSISSVLGTQTPTVSTSVKPKVKTKFSYKTINPIDKKDVKKGDWKVIDCYDTRNEMYFSGTIPKYTVRYKYYKETGVNYVDVRARKVKD